MLSKPFGIYIFIIPLYFIKSLIEPYLPVTHALIDDWFAFINFLTLFLYGFLLISVQEAFWIALDKQKYSPAYWNSCFCNPSFHLASGG